MKEKIILKSLNGKTITAKNGQHYWMRYPKCRWEIVRLVLDSGLWYIEFVGTNSIEALKESSAEFKPINPPAEKVKKQHVAPIVDAQTEGWIKAIRGKNV